MAVPPLDGPEPRPPESMQSGAVRLPSGVAGCSWLTPPREAGRQTQAEQRQRLQQFRGPWLLCGERPRPPQPGTASLGGGRLAPWDPTPSGKLLSGPGVGLPPSSARLVPRGRLLTLMHPRP